MFQQFKSNCYTHNFHLLAKCYEKRMGPSKTIVKRFSDFSDEDPPESSKPPKEKPKVKIPALPEIKAGSKEKLKSIISKRKTKDADPCTDTPKEKPNVKITAGSKEKLKSIISKRKTKDADPSKPGTPKEKPKVKIPALPETTAGSKEKLKSLMSKRKTKDAESCEPDAHKEKAKLKIPGLEKVPGLSNVDLQSIMSKLRTKLGSQGKNIVHQLKNFNYRNLSASNIKKMADTATKPSGRAMRYPYTFSAKIAQFPYNFYWKNNWLFKYYFFGCLAAIPIFYKIGKMSYAPENVRKWEEIRKRDFSGHH